MKSDSAALLRYLKKEIITDDCYGLRKAGNPAVIIDIGANCGVFALHARFLYPAATIVAFEPHPVTYEYLVRNTEFQGIRTHRAALGDGSPVGFLEGKDSGSNQSISASSGAPSYSLSGLLDLEGIHMDSGVFVKVDCEGAERFLRDPISTHLLRSSGGVGLEYHLGGRRSKFAQGMSGKQFDAWVLALNGGPLKFTTRPVGKYLGVLQGAL